jgi:hypothetical protein
MHGLIFNVNTDKQRNAGGHRIATILRQNSWDVEVLDFVYHIALDKLKEFVRQRYSSDTEFFAFGTFFSQWSNELNLFTKWLKQQYPHIPIIIGGQSVNLTPAENIDYWIDSYAENSILALLSNICNRSSGPSIKYDKSYTDRKVITSVRDYPAYPMESYAKKYEKRDYLNEHEWLATEFGRGCKFKCAFCNFPILGVKGDHTRTQKDFEEEIKRNYYEWGIKHYYTSDETFNDRPEKIRKFAEVVDSKIDFSPYFTAFNRADLLISHPESWQDLKTLGMYAHFFGIETFSHAAGKNIGKGMHPDRLKEGLLDFKKFMNDRPFRGTIALIIGLPKETHKSLDETKEWLRKNWHDHSFTSYYLNVDQRQQITNTSNIAINPEKYGISRMNSEEFREIAKQRGIENHEGALKELYPLEKNYLWQHNEMNIIDAIEKSSEFNKFKDTNKMPMEVWTLDYLTFVERTSIDRSTRWHENFNQIVGEWEAKKQDFIDAYIDKKLGYR